MKQKYNFSIVTWNVNSLYQKGAELLQFIHEHNTGIILIQETFLKPGQMCHFRNYVAYGNDRNTGIGGGTAILVKGNLNHHIINTPTLQFLEATIVKVQKEFVISAYNPPRRHQLTDDYNALGAFNGPIFIGEDLNAHYRDWGAVRSHQVGIELNRFIVAHTNLNLHIPNQPTHFGRGHGYALDIGMSPDLTNNVRINVLDELSSDHGPRIHN